MKHLETDEKVVAKHEQLLEAANSKAILLVTESGKHPCLLGGCRLKFPHVMTTGMKPPIVAELTWELVERLANGTTNEIIY